MADALGALDPLWEDAFCHIPLVIQIVDRSFGDLADALMSRVTDRAFTAIFVADSVHYIQTNDSGQWPSPPVCGPLNSVGLYSRVRYSM
jgi:hypothetical protein